MMKLIRTAAVSVLMLGSAGNAFGQESAGPPSLTLEMARVVMDASEASARANGWNVTIVVTDASGIPVSLRRLDGASPRSYDIAMRKAVTVALTGLSTSEYGRRVEAGDLTAIEEGITFAGGVPILVDGEVIGAVGTSGVQAEYDEVVSQAGADAIGG